MMRLVERMASEAVAPAGSGNERRMCLVKTNSMYPETGGISEATLLRKNTEPLLKACMKKYVSEESSRKRDRDGAKVKREEAVTISHFLHNNKVDDPLINRRGLDHAVKSGRVHSFSTPLRNPSKFYNTDNGAAFNSAHVTAVIEIDDESVEMLAGVKRGLLPGSADSTAEAIEDLKKTKDIIDAQLCECRAIERSQRMCAEIFNAVTTYFRRSYNVSRETRLRNFSTCEQDRSHVRSLISASRQKCESKRTTTLVKLGISTLISTCKSLNFCSGSK